MSTDPTIDMPKEGTVTRTIDDALNKFELVRGAGDGKTTACVMTAISWVAGEAWTDHPPCAHRLLANLAIRANDADGTTAEQRAEIVKAGASGLLDTWWVPTEVVLAAIAAAPKDATAVDHAIAVLGFVGAWKSAPVRGRPDLRGAYLRGANLRGANLENAYLRNAYLEGAKANQYTLLPPGWSVVEGLIVPDSAATDG